MTGVRRFEDKAVIVTGASSNPGIGRACALRLAQEGASLVVNARSADALEETADAARAQGSAVVTVVGSMTDDAIHGQLVDAALTHFGRLDGVVQTVGGAPHQVPVRELTQHDIVDTVVLNVWPSVALAQEAARRGLTAGGAIVTISSGSPGKTTVTMGAYAAAKAALNQLTRTLAADLARSGIRVNAVSPGLTRTTVTQPVWEADGGVAAGKRLPLGRITEAEDIAAAVAFLLSEDAASITGVLLDVDAGNHLDSGWSAYAEPAG
ncbi:MAG TPA: SDR family oxidoreductase [Mycobacteriales bacterium]|nr:SDR family oxidoreductase [Mycobacteriales bacterium]